MARELAAPAERFFPNFKEVVQVAGVVAVPAFLGAQPAAVVANLTGIAGTQSTYLELFPADQHQPLASDLNPGARDVIANLAIVELAQSAGATQGDVYLYNGLGDINAILDVAGWFPSATPPGVALALAARTAAAMMDRPCVIRGPGRLKYADPSTATTRPLAAHGRPFRTRVGQRRSEQVRGCARGPGRRA